MGSTHIELDDYEALRAISGDDADCSNKIIHEYVMDQIKDDLRNNFLQEDRKAHKYALKCRDASYLLAFVTIVLTFNNKGPWWYVFVPLAMLALTIWVIAFSIIYDTDSSYPAIKFDSVACARRQAVPLFNEEEAKAQLESTSNTCVVDIRPEPMAHGTNYLDNINCYRADFRRYHSKRSIEKFVKINNLSSDHLECMVIGINYYRCNYIANLLIENGVKVCAIVGPVCPPGK